MDKLIHKADGNLELDDPFTPGTRVKYTFTYARSPDAIYGVVEENKDPDFPDDVFVMFDDKSRYGILPIRCRRTHLTVSTEG